MSMGHIAHMNYFVSITVFSMKEKVSRGVFSRTWVLASARQISKYLQKQFWRALALLNTPYIHLHHAPTSNSSKYNKPFFD